MRRLDRLGPGSLVRTVLRAPAMSIASQGVGVVQLGLLLLRAGANEATDAFYYLFNLGMLPITGVVVGIVYPSLLNDQRLSRSDLRRLRNLVPVLCVLIVGGAAGWLTVNGRLHPGLYLLVLLSGANAVVAARLWFRAVAAEAGGQAVWIAGVALPANLVAVAALAPPWHDPATAVTAMTAGLLLGNIVFLVVMRRRCVGDAVLDGAAVTGSRSGSAWFLGTAAASFVAQTTMQSLAVLLPASGLTVLNLASKIVSSVSAAFVNATMPRLVHGHTESPAEAARFLRLVVLVEALGGLLVVVGAHLVRPDVTLPAFVVAVWMIGSGSAAVAQRMGFRFLRAHDVARRQIASVVIVVPLALLSSWHDDFSLTVLLCAYAAMDVLTGMLLLWPLKDRRMGALLALGTLTLAVVWTGAVLPG